MNKKKTNEKLKKILNQGADYLEKLMLANDLNPKETPLTLIVQTNDEDSMANAIVMRESSMESFKALTLSFFDLCNHITKSDASLFVTLYIWLKVNNKLDIFKECFDRCADLKLHEETFDNMTFLDNDSETMH